MQDVEFAWLRPTRAPCFHPASILVDLHHARIAVPIRDKQVASLIPRDEFARKALYTLMDNVNEIRADHNAGLDVEGIIINQFQARASLPQQVVAELREEGLPVLASFLSSSVKIKESHQQAKPMIHLDRNHKLALEFGALFDELEAARKACTRAAAKKRA